MLSKKLVLTLFTCKVLVGIIGGLVSHYLIHDKSDLYFYTSQGLLEYHNLINDPAKFFTDSLPNAYTNGGDGFFANEYSFWNDLRNNLILKMVGILNIFSRGNYYINSIFFNAVSFIGSVALFKIYKQLYPHAHWGIILGCFLWPSTLCFTSIIGKDLLVYSALCFFCYAVYFGLANSFTIKKITIILVSFIYILLTRNYVAIIILPMAIVWVLHATYTLKASVLYVCVGLACMLALFGMQYLPNAYNPLQIVVQKQQAFFSLGQAASQYNNDTLIPTLASFAKATPKALRHAILSPYPTEFNNIFLNAFSIEMILFILLIISQWRFIISSINKANPYIYFSIILSILMLLFIGYITTNAGSLVRYRSIYLPFFIIPLLCDIEVNKKKKN